VSTFVLCPHHYTNWHKVAVFVCACGQWRPCSGDSCSNSSTCQRAKSWNNAWKSTTTKKFHNHAGNNDLVPDQHGGKIWPNFSSVLIVNKWSVLLSQWTTTFHSDGLVNWLCECDLWICFVGAGGILYPREAGFPSDHSGRLSSAQEALASRC